MLTLTYVQTKPPARTSSTLSLYLYTFTTSIHIFTYAKNDCVKKISATRSSKTMLVKIDVIWLGSGLCLHSIDFWANYNQNQIQSLVCVYYVYFGVHFNSTKWCTTYMEHEREISAIEWREFVNEWMNQVNIYIYI